MEGKKEESVAHKKKEGNPDRTGWFQNQNRWGGFPVKNGN